MANRRANYLSTTRSWGRLCTADMDFIRGKLASAIIQEVNGEKENKSIGEAAVEKIVSLSDEA
ncbi:hypothetical protein Taro_035357 [Colocasia esculenta]|uniref:Uncharacterized protein n=1 Tax=Colocasia esculenta TaxID=4460 RepID=A0A843W0A9_COLES|nr:hypothetical protein [Colocasia esculenta]